MLAIEYETLVFETDYAPADLQAATARITVVTLVFLAACAGCDEIELVDGYPQMTGSVLQIRMIQHRQLGPPASYQAFPQRSTYHHSSLLRNYMYHLHGMGVLSYKGSPIIGLMPHILKADSVHEILLDLKAKSRMCERSDCKTAFVPLGPSPGELIIRLPAADSTSDARAFPKSVLRVRETVVELSQQCQSWSNGDVASIMERFSRLLNSRPGSLHTMDQVLLLEQALLGDRAEERTTNLFLKSPHKFFPECTINLGWSWLPEWSNRQPGVRRPPWVFREPTRLAQSDLVIVSEALKFCVDWLKDAQTMSGLTEQEDKAFKRCAITAQLQELDYWLLKNGDADAACTTQALYVAHQNGSAYSDPSSEPSISRGETPAIAATIDHPMATALVYRAVLYAVILAMALDNSDVLGTNLGRRVIHFM